MRSGAVEYALACSAPTVLLLLSANSDESAKLHQLDTCAAGEASHLYHLRITTVYMGASQHCV